MARYGVIASLMMLPLLMLRHFPAIQDDIDRLLNTMMMLRCHAAAAAA